MSKLFVLCYAKTGDPVVVEDEEDNVTFVVCYLSLLRALKEAALVSAEQGEQIIVRPYIAEKG